jgi:hypothetical protein
VSNLVIIVNETVELPNGTTEKIRKYITDDPFLTGELMKKAKENDKLIETKMREIEGEIDSMGLLERKGKRNVLPLWYEVGKRLDFVDKMELTPRARKFVWRALHDHAGGLYDHASKTPVRVIERPTTSHFHYCYIIGKKPWQFVESAGTWTDWYEFMDSIAMRKDERIIRWIDRNQSRAPQDSRWLRKLNVGIRNRLAKKETDVFSDDELYSILDEVFMQTFGDVV